MALNRRHLHGSYVDPAASLSPLRSRRFVRDYFGVQPVCYDDLGYGNPTGTGGDTNMMQTHNCSYEYNIKGTGTVLRPVWTAASGLNIGFDKADDDGVEITAGIGALSLGSFTVGADRSFYAKTKIYLADSSGTDELVFGFRKNEAYAAAHTSYTDYAAIGLITDDEDIYITTRINSGTALSIDTTHDWDDEATHTLEVQVNDDGYARFYLDDAPPDVTKTNFQFDADDVVNWFLFLVFDDTTPGDVFVNSFEFGYVPRRAE